MSCMTRGRVFDPELGRQRYVRAADGLPRYQPKMRIMSPLQMARARGGTDMNAYRCPTCGYVHLGKAPTGRHK